MDKGLFFIKENMILDNKTQKKLRSSRKGFNMFPKVGLFSPKKTTGWENVIFSENKKNYQKSEIFERHHAKQWHRFGLVFVALLIIIFGLYGVIF